MNSFLVVILNSLLQELSQGGFHICGRHCFALAMLRGAKRNRNRRNSRNCVEREVAYVCQCGQWQVPFAEEKNSKLASNLFSYSWRIKYYYRLPSDNVILVSKRSLWAVVACQSQVNGAGYGVVLGRLKDDCYQFHTSLGHIVSYRPARDHRVRPCLKMPQ